MLKISIQTKDFFDPKSSCPVLMFDKNDKFFKKFENY